MALKACGQFEAFDEDLIEKLSDREKFSLKKFCEAEHRRRERLAWRIAAERNGKFSTVSERKRKREDEGVQETLEGGLSRKAGRRSVRERQRGRTRDRGREQDRRV